MKHEVYLCDKKMGVCMPVYRVNNPRQSWYGECVGILILNAAYPCIPGNVGNATTFDFPVRYKQVREASIDRLLNQRDRSLVQPFITAARELEAEGVKAITGACGFMALFQREIAAAVSVPVFISSLLQIPFMHQISGPGRRIGIITANAAALTDDHFRAVGVSPEIPLAIAGMQAKDEFRQAVLEEKGTLDSTLMEQEVVSVARELVAQYADIGAILLECSDLPPFAHAVQAATGRPVFDFITMIRYVHTTLDQRPYGGCM
jgi:Asp/Glu/hydantoin racemase